MKQCGYYYLLAPRRHTPKPFSRVRPIPMLLSSVNSWSESFWLDNSFSHHNKEWVVSRFRKTHNICCFRLDIQENIKCRYLWFEHIRLKILTFAYQKMMKQYHNQRNSNSVRRQLPSSSISLLRVTTFSLMPWCQRVFSIELGKQDWPLPGHGEEGLLVHQYHQL